MRILTGLHNQEIRNYNAFGSSEMLPKLPFEVSVTIFSHLARTVSLSELKEISSTSYGFLVSIQVALQRLGRMCNPGIVRSRSLGLIIREVKKNEQNLDQHLSTAQAIYSYVLRDTSTYINGALKHGDQKPMGLANALLIDQNTPLDLLNLENCRQIEEIDLQLFQLLTIVNGREAVVVVGTQHFELDDFLTYLRTSLFPKAKITIDWEDFFVEICKKGFFEFIPLAINNGVIHTADVKGYTPLHYAVERGDRVVMEFLLKRGALINAQDQNGYTPLHIAVNKDCEETIIFLLDQGAEISIYDHQRDTSFLLAARKGKVNAIRALLRNLKLKELYVDRAFDRAILGRQIEVIRLLLQSGIDPKSKNEAFRKAICAEYTEVIKLFLDQNVDIEVIVTSSLFYNHKPGRRPLHFVVEAGNIEIAQMLLNAGADISARCPSGTALQLAHRKRNAEMVRFLHHYLERIPHQEGLQRTKKARQN